MHQYIKGIQMLILKTLLAVLWIAVLVVTVQAIGSQGLNAAGDIFFADLTSGAWHAQFAADFAGHLLLIAIWVAWRHKFSIAGVIFSVLCVLGGGLFSFMYILVTCIQAKADMKKLLLGAHYEEIPTTSTRV